MFVIGRPLIPENVLHHVEIKASDKALIKKELEDIFDISERTLFMDMPGFSVVNKAESPVPQIEDPAYYFFLANQFYQQGDYSRAVDSYSKCIDLKPQVSETYFLRGNAKAEMKNYPDAKQDYDLAIHHRDRPFRNWDPNTNLLFNPILWMVYFNRGNIKAELNDYEEALADYDEALQLGPPPQPSAAFFNRANIKVILHKFEDAIRDYNEAIRLDATSNAYFNKGNTLVILGHFDEACQCYDEVIREENDRTDAVNNRDRVAEILNLIGDTESEIHLTQIGDNNTELLVVDVQVPSNDLPEEMFAFQGNIGNTGNFGYNSPGGGGFGGKMGFTVRVRGSQS